MCNLLLRAFRGVNNNIISLYKSLRKVSSRLRLYNLFTILGYMYLIDLLENVLRNLCERLPGLSNLNYILIV